jgi:polyferredoxin
MSSKSTHKTLVQRSGLLLFGAALILFIGLLGTARFTLTEEILADQIGNEYRTEAVVAAARTVGLLDQPVGNSLEFSEKLGQAFELARLQLDENVRNDELPAGVSEWDYRFGAWLFKNKLFGIASAAGSGPTWSHPWRYFLLTIGLGILGGLLYILPKFRTIPGIKHDHVFHNPQQRGLGLGWRTFALAAGTIGILLYGVYYMDKDWFWPSLSALLAGVIAALVFFAERSLRNRPARPAGPENATGWLGIATGVFLIGFYVLLYWAPQHITPWIQMVDPISRALSGNPASQWFLYGLLYTIVILVMGVRMFARYRHNRYQLIRTGSVMFFQTAFAFLIPEILVRLNQPWFDFKNIWPLDYDFFYAYNLNQLLASGTLGMFMLVWGIALIVIAVPVLSYFYGKRWYCSWVCGCGGLAETLGDPFRQLSDKSLRAWKFERWIIHGVLLGTILMTALVLYGYFGGESTVLGFERESVKKWYGFFIGSAFAGVVGTGFYPLMGNRVWCRFGCPLAAYLGLVQRFKSRFRITVNGGQCISCGNCSTYCEMGIDVRHYAQRGQDVVRSSCVGCGVCAAVCPRGVLRLENAAGDIAERTTQLRTQHVPETEIQF